jgi:adenosine deaminase
MIDHAANERFQVRELVTLAKATFANLDLLHYLEADAAGQAVDMCPTARWRVQATRGAIAQTYVTGRFLRFRKLHPKLTDEALENRMAWTVASLDLQEGIWERRRLDDPAHCLVPLLTCLAETFLCEARDGSLRVRSRFLADWHDLILVVPPMLVSAAWMVARRDSPDETRQKLSDRKAFQDRVQRWLCDSTLPVDDDPFLDQLCKTEGLDETHMHINGTTEAEKVWMDALKHPDDVMRGLGRKATREDGLHAAIGDGVDRLLRQEDVGLTPRRLKQRLKQAIALKSFLLEGINADGTSHEAISPQAETSLQSRYGEAVRGRPAEKELAPTTAEALQLVDIFAALADGKGSDIYGLALHWYALIRAQFCRLLVQQVDQIGFDQFQYITLNELREATEQEYTERFRQIERGAQSPVVFLEGRFAPKATPKKNAFLLMQILRGYLRFLDETPEGKSRGNLEKVLFNPATARVSLAQAISLAKELETGSDELPRSERRLRLGLVAHFIKRTDAAEKDRFVRDKVVGVCRDSKARREADQAGRALVALLQKTEGLSDLVRGMDAASNERHAGPEVFAQVFRRMRRAKIRRFSYHVGEDFVHLASGLRAINEAVLYLDLTAGCRIGHGTAAGLTPGKWWDAVGGSVIQPCEDRLDDLVFAWGTLLKKCVLSDRLPLIEAEIRRLAMYIWGDPQITPDVLLRSWKIRHIDPIVRYYGRHDVDIDRDAEIRMFRESQIREPEAHGQFLRRHGVGLGREARIRARSPVLVNQQGDVLDSDILEALQFATLELLQERRVAIETLPSSNVRISIHQSYDEHHALGWLGYGRKFCPVSVVIGTDDPGIFATSLRAEYAHIRRALEVNGAGAEAETLLQDICRTSKRFRF